MRKKVLWISMLAVAMLSACTTKENNEKPIMTPTPTVTIAPTETLLPTPTNTPVATPTPTKEQAVQIYLRTLDTIDWMELESNVDEETSRHNSNFLNYGYLDYDTEGNIYYINKNDGGIYASTCRGENKRLLSDEKVAEAMLQRSGEWLFYYNKVTKGIDKIHINTCEKKYVFDHGPFGQFVIEGDKIYARNDGFCSFDLDGTNREVLPNAEEAELFYPSRGNGFWIGKSRFFPYLLMYDGKKVVKLNQQGTLPLLAGKYLSVIDPDTMERHIWNLETKKDSNLKVCTDKSIVSDGNVFFYAGMSKFRDDDYVTAVYSWDGTKPEEIISAKGARSIDHMFLTPEYLYYLPQLMVDEKLVYQLWYYELSTGETGLIY